MLDFDTCNEARLRRDAAFDGLFFTAVRTTGIYCRPVRPVKHPLTKNVSYYPTAAAAERAGYRPCLRCRPEAAPFCPAWKGSKTTVERALQMIEDAALDHGTVETLAERLGIGARHLTRLTRLANKGVGVRLLAALAGHSHISTTQRYIDVNAEQLASAVELL